MDACPFNNKDMPALTCCSALHAARRLASGVLALMLGESKVSAGP